MFAGDPVKQQGDALEVISTVITITISQG